MLFPGHRYLGPGNPLDNGVPVDLDDYIAREHDRRYSQAQTDQDVFDADHEAINDFVSDWSDRGSFHSLVGAAGLGLKNLVEEHVLGRSLYGRSGGDMSGRKRGNSSGGGDSPEFKRPYGSQAANFVNDALYSGQRSAADSTSQEAQPSEAVRDGQGGTGIGSNTENDGILVQQILRVPRDQGMVRVHRDSKLLTTWGYALVKTEITYAHSKSFKGYFTSMSRLPVEFPYLYMAPAHFTTLTPNTRAVKCSAKITPHGIRTPWKTGSSVVQPVNSDMMVYGVSAVGLNLYLDTGMCVPGTGTADNAMMTANPTEFKLTDHRDLIKKYWATTITEREATQTDTIPTCMGVPRHNKCYDFIHVEDYSPRTTKFVNTYPFKSHIGTPIVNYEYEFQDGWLRTCPPYCTNTKTYISAPVESLTKTASCLDTDMKDTEVKTTALKLEAVDRGSQYEEPIEREWGRKGLGPSPNTHAAQPSVGFGIMAVSKKAQDVPGSDTKFQEVAAFFQVDTELVLHSDNDTINPRMINNPAQEQHFTKNTFDMYIPNNRQTHLGHYTYFPKTSQ